MAYLLEVHPILGGIFIAAVITSAHCFVLSWLCRIAIRRLYAIQDEMGRLCKHSADPDTNQRMDSLAHEAAHLLARFDIDYWAALERQPSRNKERKDLSRK